MSGRSAGGRVGILCDDVLSPLSKVRFCPAQLFFFFFFICVDILGASTFQNVERRSPIAIAWKVARANPGCCPKAQVCRGKCLGPLVIRGLMGCFLEFPLAENSENVGYSKMNFGWISSSVFHF